MVPTSSLGPSLKNFTDTYIDLSNSCVWKNAVLEIIVRLQGGAWHLPIHTQQIFSFFEAYGCPIATPNICASKEIKSRTLIEQCSVVPEHNKVLVERFNLRIEQLDMASQPFNISVSATELENDGIDYYLCPNCTTSLSRAGI